jgi:predicted Zn-dependent protease
MMLARSYVFSYRELHLTNFVELTLEQLNYIVKKDPKFPGVHHHIALVYINGGEPGKAVEELSTELRYYPANAQARMELGETLLKLNQYHKAVEELVVAARQTPQMASIPFALAKAYKAEGQTGKALEARANVWNSIRNLLPATICWDSSIAIQASRNWRGSKFELFQQLKNPSASPQ